MHPCRRRGIPSPWLSRRISSWVLAPEKVTPAGYRHTPSRRRFEAVLSLSWTVLDGPVRSDPQEASGHRSRCMRAVLPTRFIFAEHRVMKPSSLRTLSISFSFRVFVFSPFHFLLYTRYIPPGEIHILPGKKSRQFSWSVCMVGAAYGAGDTILRRAEGVF